MATSLCLLGLLPRRLSPVAAAVALVITAGASPALPQAGPPNDTCAAPLTLQPDLPVTGNTHGAADDYRVSGSGCYQGMGQTPLPGAGGDVVYTFVAPGAGSYSFRVTGYAGPGDLVLQVATQCPAAPGPVGGCLSASNRLAMGGAEELMCVTLAAGQRVYVYVDEAAASAGGSFWIEANRCVLEAAGNDTPAAAGPRSCPAEGSSGTNGEVDFFTLGYPGSGARVFAIADGVAANISDFELRVTTTVDTREYDDADNDAPFGVLAPNVGGTPLLAGESFLKVNQRQGVPAEPYRLYGVVQPAAAGATAESEPNGTIGDADSASNNYFSGSLATPGDTDLFRFSAKAGDLIVLGLDGDPQRDATPVNAALALLDAAGGVLVAVDDANASSVKTPGPGLSAFTPHSPAEGLTYRARTSGTYYARVTGGGGDFLLSIAIDCRTFPATNLSLTKTASPACVTQGSALRYEIGVTNGAAAARNVIVTDPLPPEVAYASATPSQGTCRGTTTVTCFLGDMAANGTATIVIDVTAETSGHFVNQASVTADTADTNPSNDTAQVETNGACQDGNACTTGETCQAGSCAGGQPVDCNDLNLCTDDACDPQQGCQHAFNTLPCDDGNPCTEPDQCGGGACAGPPADCSDGNPCTDDACSFEIGCWHDFNTAPCDDQNPCSVNDGCSAGTCRGGTCGGTCPGTGKECVQDLYEQCVCVDGAVPCGGQGPLCEGECPSGLDCAHDAGSGTCTCRPPAPCGDGEYPECYGSCPSGLRCEPESSPNVTPPCSCKPVTPPCGSTHVPECGGSCPAGYACTPAGQACACVASSPLCGQAEAPRCGGGCPEYYQCRPNPAGSACACVPLDQPCGMAQAPACNGRCAPDERCAPTTNGACACEPDPCGDAPFPQCGGTCPIAGEVCRADEQFQNCVCRSDLVDCGQAAAPACGGLCPAGQVCEPSAGGQACSCVPVRTPCGQAQAPLCEGDCAADDVCRSGPNGCFCTPPVMDCGTSQAPACGGNCPAGQNCGLQVLGDGCECREDRAVCQFAGAPACGGECPPGTQCMASPNAGPCACRACEDGVPSPDITLLFGSHTRLGWSAAECATAYHVYRRVGGIFTDSDGDGLADDYGSCYLAGSLIRQLDDFFTPKPRTLVSYLVTGVNALGEGGLGFTSAGLTRPNRAPCP